ncbi:hypothetical protein [Streptomyces acidiscabies]|uniref:hypothetical protein n=1 Tax=Streptomyces acidiscabies TaxID=42234 RepID=UPI0038F71B1C
MHDFIRCIAARLLGVLVPGSGRRRAGFRAPVKSSVRYAAVPCPGVRLPVHRSPYGLDVPLDGAGVTMVRPYVIGTGTGREGAA